MPGLVAVVFVFNGNNYLFFFFSASPGISFFGRDANDPGYELYAIFGYMLMLVTVTVRIRTSDQVLCFLRTITAIGFLTSLYGLLQYLGVDPFGFGQNLAFSGSRIYSTYDCTGVDNLYAGLPCSQFCSSDLAGTWIVEKENGSL